MTELKPCPFCGNSAWHYTTYKIHAEKTRHVVKCSKCNANMEYRSAQAAINAWNRRAKSDENEGLNNKIEVLEYLTEIVLKEDGLQ